jgi:hypothetical protein
VPTGEPTAKCHVFVSRRTDDRHVFAEEITAELAIWAAGRLTFFDARKIAVGELWKETIADNLEQASLFFLILTGSSDAELNWLLYEAGWFKGLSKDRHGKIACFVPQGWEVPTQLDDLQAVHMTRESVIELLLKLYHDKSYTNTRAPLNPAATESMLEPIASKIIEAIDGSNN